MLENGVTSGVVFKMKNLKEEISAPEYEKMYRKMLEEVARKNFHGLLYTFAFLTILLTVGIVLMTGISTVTSTDVYMFYGVLAVIFGLALLMDKLRFYKYKNYKIEEGVVSIERLKEIFREQKKNTTKECLLTSLGIHAFAVVVLASFNYTLHGFSPEAIQGYIFLAQIFIVLGLIAVINELELEREYSRTFDEFIKQFMTEE